MPGHNDNIGVFRQVFFYFANGILLNRTDIGKNNAFLQMRNDLSGNLAVCTDRRCINNQIGIFDGLPQIFADFVNNAQLPGFGQIFLIFVTGAKLSRQSFFMITRASEEPISPIPIMVILSKSIS